MIVSKNQIIRIVNGVHRRIIRFLERQGSSIHENMPDKPIMVVSLHKSGTHLITNILEQCGLNGKSVGNNAPVSAFNSLRADGYLWSHYNPSQGIFDLIELGKIKTIFHYRDPRDVVVSRFNWQHPKNKKVTNVTREFLKKVHARFKDDQEFLQFIIRGERHIPHEINFIDQFRLSRGLLFHPNVFKTNFETLIGTKGGGDNNAQVEMIRNLLAYLELEGDPEQIAERAFSEKSETFHKGQIGAYKKVFSKETKDLFNQHHGDILQDYGYK